MARRRDALPFQFRILCATIFDARSAGASRDWDVVVLDEAQRIKNPKSAVASAMKSLKRRRSWALTGTPLENRLDDLISLLDFAAPGEFDPSAMGRGLRGLMERVRLRRRRAEVLDDLPPKFASVIALDLDACAARGLSKGRDRGNCLAPFAGTGTANHRTCSSSSCA